MSSVTIACNTCCKKTCRGDSFDRQVPGKKCLLTFIYENINAVQDDAWDIELETASGEWVKAGNIDGVCQGYADPEDECACANVDRVSFQYTVDKSFVAPEADCAIRFRSKLTQDRGCGTFGTFDIEGPKGRGFGGYLGGEGLIDITAACIG